MASLESKKENILKFEGAIAAVATPFNNEGKIDVSQIPIYAKHVINIGAKGIYILGTTGEGFSLNFNEKLDIVRAWHQALTELKAKNGIHLTAIVHITSTVFWEMKELAKEVEKLNFDAIALLPSLYYKNTKMDWLIDYLQNVSSAAPNTPLYYYYSPKATGELSFKLERFIGEALDKIPQFAGFKFACFDMALFGQVISLYGDRLNIMPGCEEILLPAAAFGARAANCTLFSFAEAVQAFNTIQAAFNGSNGSLEEARKIQRALSLKREAWKSDEYYYSHLKEALNSEPGTGGLFVGKARPPICFDLN